MFFDLTQSYYELDAKILNLGNRSIAYPSYNQAVILAGGAASGKSFVMKNVISIRGKVFDVDYIKTSLPKLKNQKLQDDFREFSKKYLGYELELSSISNDSLKDPSIVQLMHEFESTHKYNDKLMQAMMFAATSSKHKPNVIFDVTLKDFRKLIDIADLLDIGNYNLENRHLVWVLSPFDLSIRNNQERDRRVPEDILLMTHAGVSRTIYHLIKSCDQSMIDGDVYIVFNNRDLEDTLVRQVGNKTKTFLLDHYTCFRIKAARQPWISYNEISAEILDKIKSYVPDSTIW